MANPTTNYGWPMPTSTDLVTDLPADFAAFGQPVDTSLKALNPETTLGDISYRSATANTNTRLAIGSAGQVLKVNSGGTAPDWGAAASTDTFTLLNSGDTTVGISTSKTWSSLTAKNTLFIAVESVSSDTNNAFFDFDFTTTASGKYSRQQLNTSTTAVTAASISWRTSEAIRLGRAGLASGILVGYVLMQGANSTTAKPFTYQGSATPDANNAQWMSGGGVWDNAAVISSVTISTSVGNFDGGNVYIYGA